MRDAGHCAVGKRSTVINAKQWPVTDPYSSAASGQQFHVLAGHVHQASLASGDENCLTSKINT